MDIVVTGVNHKTAPVEIRERLAVRQAEIPDFLCALTGLPRVAESLILSTCNRMEIWCAVESATGHRDKIVSLLQRTKNVSPSELADCLYVHHLPDSIRHLFLVASSLDSMVLGETQIIGQVKDAYRLAQATDTVGKILSAAFEQAFSTAKRVRTETQIGQNPVSVSSVAIHLAEKVLGNLAHRKILIIGAGKIGTVTAKAIVDKGASQVMVTNRNPRRAEDLAVLLHGEAVPFDRMFEALHKADVVIACTEAPHAILKKDDLEKTMKARRHGPLFLIDLAVPRDVEPEAAGINDLYLYDIDSLQEVAEEHVQLRKGEVDQCRQIVSEEAGKFLVWLDRQSSEPIIKQLAERWDKVCLEETEKTLLKLSNLSPEQKKEVELLASRITRRLRHAPMQSIKKSPARLDGETVEAYLTRLLLGDEP